MYSLKKVAIKNSILRLLPERMLFYLKKLRYVHSLRSFYEKDIDVVKLLVKPSDYVVDIGANVGWYTKILSELVSNKGCVYSIEPIPTTFELLSFCVKKLGLNNVELMNYAMSEKNGYVHMEVPLYESGGENFYQSKIVENKKSENSLKTFKVESKSIDSLFFELNNKISFIKCDVEGHEFSVIKGAERVVKKSKPAWLIEISGNPDNQDSNSYLLFNYLEKHGYTAYWFDGQKLNRYSPGDKSINYFFLTSQHLALLEK